jgi:hypothetical protein
VLRGDEGDNNNDRQTNKQTNKEADVTAVSISLFTIFLDAL